jgi:hypothetical protein
VEHVAASVFVIQMGGVHAAGYQGEELKVGPAQGPGGASAVPDLDLVERPVLDEDLWLDELN